jgi:hypothetical protein
MSLFGKSFEREIGKNTGKWVSNVIFGDGHATPYRRAESRQQQKITQQRINEENLHSQRIAQIKLESNLKSKEQLLIIDRAVLENVDKVLSIRIPNTSQEIQDFLSELSVQLRTNKWHKNSDEGKIRNKYNEAILEICSQAILKLKSIDSENSKLEYYEKLVANYKRSKYIKKFQTAIIVASVLFLVALLVIIEEGLFWYFSIPIITIALLYVGLRYYKRQQNVDNAKITEIRSDENNSDKEKELNHENTIITDVNIFFDLNQNCRIEKRLSDIWRKYEKSIDVTIIGRRPIFSADAVNNSILYVGINPSFNSSEDDSLIKSADNKSLMYGSFYQRSDAPDYFKALELFAKGCDYGYTHINLLYARENDREKLLNCDHNFIREQLELTYETIQIIKPMAILFFGDYCKDLIYGAERWVDPKTEKNSAYHLNGVNIPVFFTNDVTTLTTSEHVDLIEKIKLSVKPR